MLDPASKMGWLPPGWPVGRGEVEVAQGLWDQEGEEEGGVCPRPWVGQAALVTGSSPVHS